MRVRPFVIVMVCFLIVSCGDDKSTTPSDSTAPGTILDVTITDSLGTSMRLTWTASGDDGAEGTAAEYEIRYAMEPLNAQNWDNATEVTSPPEPAAAGETETLNLDELTWWTRYYVGIKVGDDAGNWSAISNVAAGTPYPHPSSRFLVQSRDGVMRVDMEGDYEVFLPSNREVEVTADRIYTGANDIYEYDLNGVSLGTIDTPEGTGAWYFAALPGRRFLLMNNSTDTVHIIDDTGALLAARALLPSPSSNLQSMEAVVAGDYVIISEDGQNHLMQINLNTYEISQFKDLTSLSGWLGAVDYYDGTYCLCQSQNVYEFTAASDPVLLATMPVDDFNITGAVAAGGHIFAVLNFAGKLVRVNRTTGEIVTFAEGLDYPQDVEFVPAP